MKTRTSPSVILSADEAPSSSITRSSITTPVRKLFRIVCGKRTKYLCHIAVEVFCYRPLKSEQRSETNASHLLICRGIEKPSKYSPPSISLREVQFSPSISRHVRFHPKMAINTHFMVLLATRTKPSHGVLCY